LKKSDVLIDQLIIGWYGLQSIEGVLSNNLVLCHMESDLVSFAAEGCPIIPVDSASLKAKLIEIIEGGELSFARSYDDDVEWVRSNHTIERNNAALLSAWAI
jgi:hypothetical protein